MKRAKLLTILVIALLGALTLGAWTQPWFTIVLKEGHTLVATGQVAAPSLSALGLASLALAAALSIAGRVVRIVLAVLQVFIGVLVVVSALSALGNPVGASAKTLTDAVGESGADALAGLVASVSVGVWPVLALVLGVLSALAGVALFVTGPRWPGPTRRYETTPAPGETTAGSWDALSSGHDPT